MPQVSALSCTISNEMTLLCTASQASLCTHLPVTKACQSSASPLSKTLALGTWRLHSLAQSIFGFPILGLQIRFRWFSLTRLKTFALFQCSPTRVRTCLSSLCTVKLQSSPTILSDGALLLASGTTSVPQSRICSKSSLMVVATPNTIRT